MKQFGLRYLYKHLGKAIKLLPFEVTNHNRVIAVVISKEEYDRLIPFRSGLDTLVKESYEQKK